MKTTLYVLTGEFSYEGGTPIGVYSSFEAARKAAAVCGFGYDYFRLTPLTLDSAAEDDAVFINYETHIQRNHRWR